MNPITCIVVDDEPESRETFKEIIARFFSGRVTILTSVDSVKAAVEAIREFSPQIVFLDVEMPGESGIRLFDYFPTVDFDVVFVTAHAQYAIPALKIAALDYLLKPLNYIDLMATLTRYEKKQGSYASQMRIENLLTNLSQGLAIDHKIALPTRDGYMMEPVNDVVYCEADVNYSIIHTTNGKSIVVAKTLKYIEELLPPEHFFRIHKSYLINLNYLKSYSKAEGFEIILETGQKLPVAQRKNEEFLAALTKKV